MLLSRPKSCPPPVGTHLVPLGVVAGLAGPLASAHAVIFFPIFILFFIYYFFKFRMVGWSNPLLLAHVHDK